MTIAFVSVLGLPAQVYLHIDSQFVACRRLENHKSYVIRRVVGKFFRVIEFLNRGWHKTLVVIRESALSSIASDQN